MKIGIIGGSGISKPGAGKRPAERIPIETPYGVVEVQHTAVAGRDVFFLNRHGKGHAIPPHLINYRANIRALKLAGVTRVLATCAVGTMNPAIQPGDLVVLDTFLDFTKGRAASFSSTGDVFHVDMTEPFCPQMREVFISAATRKGLPRPGEIHAGSRNDRDGATGAGGVRLHSRGVYVCAEGPRFETPAEIRAFRLLGGDVVGMTAVPECVLAREDGLCYAGIAVSTNWAAGIAARPPTPHEVNAMMAKRFDALRELLERAIAGIPEARNCGCESARDKGRVKP